MSKPTVVVPVPGAFQRFRLSIGTGVLLGVLFALLLVYVSFHAFLSDEPEHGNRLLWLYLLVGTPAGLAGGLYGLRAFRQDLVRVDGSGIDVDTPTTPQQILWSDVLCIRIIEDRTGKTLRIRLYNRDGGDLRLFSYLPLDTIRTALLERRPPHVVVEVVQRRIDWLDPDLHNMLLGALVALLTVALWIVR